MKLMFCVMRAEGYCLQAEADSQFWGTKIGFVKVFKHCVFTEIGFVNLTIFFVIPSFLHMAEQSSQLFQSNQFTLQSKMSEKWLD